MSPHARNLANFFNGPLKEQMSQSTIHSNIMN